MVTNSNQLCADYVMPQEYYRSVIVVKSQIDVMHRLSWQCAVIE